jgi:hypothetical protein
MIRSLCPGQRVCCPTSEGPRNGTVRIVFGSSPKMKKAWVDLDWFCDTGFEYVRHVWRGKIEMAALNCYNQAQLKPEVPGLSQR